MSDGVVAVDTDEGRITFGQLKVEGPVSALTSEEQNADADRAEAYRTAARLTKTKAGRLDVVTEAVCEGGWGAVTGGLRWTFSGSASSRPASSLSSPLDRLRYRLLSAAEFYAGQRMTDDAVRLVDALERVNQLRRDW